MSALFSVIECAAVPRTARLSRAAAALIALAALGSSPARADYFDDVGYTLLQSELGAGIPDGAAVPVSQIEAAIQVGPDLAWMPNPASGEFAGKTITDESGAVPGLFSGHATSVGRRFYGSVTSTSPGVTSVSAWVADHWLGSGFLRVSTGGPNFQPRSSASRVSNHSWVGTTTGFDAQALAKLDWAIATDEMLQAVGFTGSVANPLLSSAYNVLSVNRTAAPTTTGSATAGGIYNAGRTKPEIVAPASSPSNAVPRAASAVAMLVDLGHANPGLSTDPAGISMVNRNGDTIYNAERTEVIKAALMAGADRETANTTSADITDYRADPADRTANGLDRRYGAGQLNMHSGYHVVAAGEQNSIEDLPGGAGLIGATGFDYDPAFGGVNASNATATYFLPTTAGTNRLTAALVWNLAIDGGTANNFDETATLYDLDLTLFDVTDPGNWLQVAGSQSTNENTENLWQLLDTGKDYALRVERGAAQAQFDWDYALAWQVTPVALLTVDPIVLPNGKVNRVYAPQTLTASNGQAPYTWSLAGGALPPGLTLGTDGVISGTPMTVTTAMFTVQVTDASSDTATLDLQIKVTIAGYVCGACHAAAGF